jgi:hypothetical protein
MSVCFENLNFLFGEVQFLCQKSSSVLSVSGVLRPGYGTITQHHHFNTMMMKLALPRMRNKWLFYHNCNHEIPFRNLYWYPHVTLHASCVQYMWQQYCNYLLTFCNHVCMCLYEKLHVQPQRLWPSKHTRGMPLILLTACIHDIKCTQ